MQTRANSIDFTDVSMATAESLARRIGNIILHDVRAAWLSVSVQRGKTIVRSSHQTAPGKSETTSEAEDLPCHHARR